MKNVRIICAIALAAVIVFSMAGCTAAVPVPDQLVGAWSIGGTEIFRITTDRKFLISGSEYDYTIMSSSALGAASGTIVVGYANSEIGRLDYSLNSGNLAINNGTAAFVDWIGMVVTGGGALSVGTTSSSAPGGSVPSQLVGTWSAGGIDTFRITSDRIFFIYGGEYDYAIMPSSVLGAASGTIVVGYAGVEIGRFDYRISGGRMTISGGTAAFATWTGLELTGGGTSGSSTSSGSTSGGSGAVPSQLVGSWSTYGLTFFRISSDSKFFINDGDLEYEYAIMPSSTLGAASGTIVIGLAGIESGRFSYILSGGEMTMSSGAGALQSWSGFTLTK